MLFLEKARRNMFIKTQPKALLIFSKYMINSFEVICTSMIDLNVVCQREIHVCMGEGEGIFEF